MSKTRDALVALMALIGIDRSRVVTPKAQKPAQPPKRWTVHCEPGSCPEIWVK